MKPVELFHIGPPKTATTWFYRCLSEHPEIATSSHDTIHYYDIHHHRGDDWYKSHFKPHNEQQKLFDPTPSYLVSHRAPKRIKDDNPDAKFFFVLRHPIERAFSHYWHEKKFGVIQYDFKKVLDVFQLFESWLGMGLLADQLELWFEHFPQENFHFVLYEDIKNEPKDVFKNLAKHYGIDDNFVPEFIDKKINVAGPRMNVPQRAIAKLGRGLKMQDNKLVDQLSGKSEYIKGVEPEFYNQLLPYCMSDIERMEKILKIDLSHWKIEMPLERPASHG